MAEDPKSPPSPGHKRAPQPRATSPDSSPDSPENVQKIVEGTRSMAELKGITPQEMLAIAMQGYQFYEQGRYDKAKIIFEGLCSLEPKEAYYRTALGAVYLAMDDLPMAEQLLTAAISISSDELASYVNRGEVYLRQGKILEAAQDFKRAVELDPDQKDPISQRARLLAAATLETIRSAQRKSGGAQPATPLKKK